MNMDFIEFAIRVAIVEGMHAEISMKRSAYHNSNDFCQYYTSDLDARDVSVKNKILKGKKVNADDWQCITDWVIKLSQQFRLKPDQVDEMVARIITTTH